jgi:hypothetical protein
MAGMRVSEIVGMFDTNENGTVSIVQFDAGLRRIGTVFDFSELELLTVFEALDLDHDGALSIEEWSARCKVLSAKFENQSFGPGATFGRKASEMQSGRKASEMQRVQTGTMKNYGAHVSRDKALHKYDLTKWGMLYCGGSKPVIDALKSASSTYNIDLKTESFDW